MLTFLLCAAAFSLLREIMRMLPAYITIVLVLVAVTFLLPVLMMFPRTECVLVSPEGRVIATLRSLHNVQAEFQASKERFGTLQELASMGLIDSRYASGQPVAGFVYSDEISAQTYCIKANRSKDSVRSGDFNVIEDGEIRYVESTTLGSAVCGKGALLRASTDQ